VLSNLKTVYHKKLQKKKERKKATETNYSGFSCLKMLMTITITSPNPYPLLPPGQNRSMPGRYKTLAKQLLKLRKTVSREVSIWLTFTAITAKFHSSHDSCHHRHMNPCVSCISQQGSHRCNTTPDFHMQLPQTLKSLRGILKVLTAMTIACMMTFQHPNCLQVLSSLFLHQAFDTFSLDPPQKLVAV